MKITGKVEKVMPVQSGQTKKGDAWEKQVFTVRTSDEYDNLYAFDAFGEKGMEQMKGVKEGANVEVEFNIRTNEYKEKFYTSLSPWKVDVVSGGGSAPAQPQASTKQEDAFAGDTDDSNDLPF